MSITPEDFSSNQPPRRPIGIECEYNLQRNHEDSHSNYAFVQSMSMNRAGVTNHNGYLGQAFGSGKAYPDVGHLEFDTAEAYGPASAAVEDIDGIERISKIVSQTGHEHNGLYRLAGTYIQNGLVAGMKDRMSTGQSSGYHENYLFPRHFSEDELLDKLIPTMLATRIWAMSGTLRREGFVFSQKVWGIGGNPVERTLSRRTNHGNKPMVIIPPHTSDSDTIGTQSWARMEVRMADPGLSVVNRYLAFAALSLSLRLIENQAVIGREAITNCCLAKPVEAAKMYAQDLTLAKTSETLNETQVSMLDTQESLLDLFESMAEKDITLPEDEVFAIAAIRKQVDALRVSNPHKVEYTNVARARIDFAPRHQFITGTEQPASINALNHIAMQKNLLWDRVLPIGPGVKYWQQISEKDPLVSKLKIFALNAGIIERAIRRAAIIDSKESMGSVTSWAAYRDPSGNECSLGSPAGK